MPAAARIRTASACERRTLERFLEGCDVPAVARRVKAIIATIDGDGQADIARSCAISQPILRSLQRAYVNAGPIGLVEGRIGWAGRKSTLSPSIQDDTVTRASASSVRTLAKQARVSKSALHRTIQNARKIEQFVGFGGGYTNPRHYFLVCGIAVRPDRLKSKGPLCGTYVELFAKRSESDWDILGHDRVLSYLAMELSRLKWEGTLQIVANPKLAAVASSSEWFGNCDGVAIHSGPNARIWHYLLDNLIGLRPPGWHCRALRALRSFNTTTATSCHWMTEYLALMEWRASRSPWKSVEFTTDASSLYAAQQNPRLTAQLLRAREILEVNWADKFLIYPIWD